MKTFIAKPQEVEKKWYILDAENKVLGRIATVIADKLRGKGKPIFAPHMDCGDFVIVINAEKIKLTGNKEEKKVYSKHSGYPGGYREIKAGRLLELKPTKLLEFAVKGMLPKNRLRNGLMKKLKLYAGTVHPHEAQKAETLEV